MADRTIYIDIAGRLDKYEKTLRKAEKRSQSAQKKMESGFKKIGQAAIAAFSVDRLVAFGTEAVQLAAKAEGVKSAFDKLNDPRLLANLRTATRGTISDLQLMQIAVRAENFNIPLSQLSTLLEFAQKRAQQTGESVDYLVNSIVDGIGRKSTLVLDNLGISASELQQEVKAVGDFGVATGNIVRRELESMGEVMDTTKTKLDRLAASWENFKVDSGEIIVTWFDRIKNFFDAFLASDGNMTIGMIYSVAIDKAIEKQEELNELIKEARNTAREEVSESLETMNKDEIKEQIDLLNNVKNSYSKFADMVPFESEEEDLAYLNTKLREFQKALAEINEEEIRDKQEALKQKTKSEAEYYNTVKWLDQNYYNYRKGLIEQRVDEFRQAGLSEIQIEKFKLQQMQKLNEEFKANFGGQVQTKGFDTGSETPTTLDTVPNKLSAVNESFMNLGGTVESITDQTLYGGFMGFFDQMVIKADWANSMIEQGFVSMANAMIRAITNLVAEWMTMWAVKSLVMGEWLNPLGVLSFMTGAKDGGAFYGGNKVASFASGGSFQVPAQFTNDSFPMMVDAGELVEVTPRNKVGEQVKVLNDIKKVMMAQTMAINDLKLQVNVNNNIDPKSYVRKTLKPAENQLAKNNTKMDSII